MEANNDLIGKLTALLAKRCDRNPAPTRNQADVKFGGSQRWTMLSHRTVDAVFHGWGATSHLHIKMEDTRHVYMVRLDDGKWYYAHQSSDTPTSVYLCMTEAYTASSGEEAYQLLQIDGALMEVEALKMRLEVEMAGLQELNKTMEFFWSPNHD